MTAALPAGNAIDKLRQASPTVLPSMLQCDFTNLEREVRRLEDAGVSGLHLDVMDGHFVPNFTYGLTIIDAFRKLTELPLDAHLMIANPGEYAAQFVDAGADIVTIHIEAAENTEEILGEIKSRGAAAGLAVNPSTSLDAISDVQHLADLLLVMSVQPGFGGQSFQEVALEKLVALRDNGKLTALLEVDGGVNDQTIGRCASAGADLAVVGSAIFAHEDYSARLSALMHTLRGD
ncbi:MAG: ribulose-phosphate 3-epimerase [Pirellulales bacterium]|nr:ribulose-phosphate 3-epimerase [Pirellulales bacterium]